MPMRVLVLGAVNHNLAIGNGSPLTKSFNAEL